MQEGRWMYWNFEKWLFWVVILTWIWPNSSPRLLSVQYVENKVTYMNCLHTWTERSIIVEFMVKFTWQHNLPVGSYCTFKMPSGRLDFWCSRAKNETPPLPPPPVTPKLKVRELSQSGFWNIWSHPTSVPSFSQISWPQLLAPGTLFRTMTLKPTIGTPQPYSSFKYKFCTSYLRRILLPFTPIVLKGWFSLSMELVS